MNFAENAQLIFQRNLELLNTKKDRMTAIIINKKERESFLKAVNELRIIAEELTKVDDKNYDHFFIQTHSQDAIFQLGVMHATFVQISKKAPLKQTTLFN